MVETLMMMVGLVEHRVVLLMKHQVVTAEI